MSGCLYEHEDNQGYQLRDENDKQDKNDLPQPPWCIGVSLVVPDSPIDDEDARRNSKEAHKTQRVSENDDRDLTSTINGVRRNPCTTGAPA